jgi:hypothetical protein
MSIKDGLVNMHYALCTYNLRIASVQGSTAMHKRITITLDEDVYDGLYKIIGKRRISQFIEDLVRPHVLDTALDDGYRLMAADTQREAEALEWVNIVSQDMQRETR